jgi:hypothetical protein
MAVLLDGGDTVGIFVRATERRLGRICDQLGLSGPVGQDLRHMGEGAHDGPLAGFRLVVEDVGRQCFDFLQELLDVPLQALDAFFGGHPAECSLRLHVLFERLSAIAYTEDCLAMENEELAALRATLLAAQRQPLAMKVRQARLSALVADGDELLPYVLSRSCSDPRDRTLEREELAQLRVLEGGSSETPQVARVRRMPAHEPIPTRPSRLAAFLAVLIVLCLLSQMAGMALIHWR